MRIILTLSLVIFGTTCAGGQDFADPQPSAFNNFTYQQNQPAVTPAVRFLRFEPPTAFVKKSISEDASVLSYMISKGMNLVSQRNALGVAVPQYHGKSEAIYSDSGLTLIYHVPFLLIDEEVKKEATTKKELSPWQKAKLEMAAKNRPANPNRVQSNWNVNFARPSFDKDLVDSLKKQIHQALENAGNFKDLQSDDSITVFLNGSSFKPGHRAILGWKVNMSEFANGKIKSPDSIKTVEYSEASDTRPASFLNKVYQATPEATYVPKYVPQKTPNPNLNPNSFQYEPLDKQDTLNPIQKTQNPSRVGR